MSLVESPGPDQKKPKAPEEKPGFLARVQTAYEQMMKRANDTVAGVSLSNTFFQPGQPYRPAGPDDMTGRALDYPTNYNVNLQPRAYDSISFGELRLLAEFHDITRLMIETRKDQVEALNWTIKPSFEPKTATQKADMLKRAGITQAFMEYPDGTTSFSQWMRQLVEDILVIDAPCIWVDESDPLNTKFKIIDGATMKIVIDEDGRTPEPPSPAYQQIIKGIPAWNYTADDVIYMPRNPRPGRIYGMSPVQQIVITVNICLRRQASQLQYFTDGNIPDSLIATPEDWTPEQIIAYQKAWDALFEGQTANRRRAKFVPGGVTMTQTKEAILKDAFDEWLLKICAFAFSIPASAFIAQVNRATAQTVKDASEQEGLAPLLRHLKRICDVIIQKHLGQFDLEFDWADREETDPAEKATIHDTKVRNGTLTINEARAEDGLDPVEGGDVPVIFTASGPIPVASFNNLPVAPPPPPIPPDGAGDGGENDQGDGKEPKAKPPGNRAPGNASSFSGDKGEGEGQGKQSQNGNKGGTGKSASPFVVAPTLFRKSATKPLYVRRPLLNAGEVIEWAKAAGFEQTITADDMHVTQVYSKAPVNWDIFNKHRNIVTVGVSRRSVHQFPGGATVLRFESFKLRSRFRQFMDGGCSFGYDNYSPHITLTYQDHGLNLDAIEPFRGDLILGPEIFEELDEGWKDGVVEKSEVIPIEWGHRKLAPDLRFYTDLNKYSDDQPRDEAGRWTDGGGGGIKNPPEGRVSSHEGVTKAQAAAVKSYAYKGDGQVNGDLRDPTNFKGNATAAQNKIDKLDAAMNSSTTKSDVVVYRGGGGWDRNNGYEGQEGKEITLPGYTSTSLSQRIAARFGSTNSKETRTNFKIFVPKGSNAIVRNEILAKNMWDNPFWREREVILPRSGHFTIDKVDASSHTVYLRMTGHG